MSDFAGLWRLDGRPVDTADIERLARGMEGRGIGAPRLWRSGAFAMVHRQHVFTPEDELEAMPWVGASGAVLAADIRLDDRAGLASALGLGRDAAALPDGRLALHALEQWGTEAPRHLYGDWALALWQPDRQRLVLARDAQISRTLFFHRGPRLVAFATRLRPLLALPEIPLDLDELAVADRLILNHGTPERTHYQAIDRVPQGRLVVLTGSAMRSTRWWTMPEPGSLRFRRRAETVEAAGAAVDLAVGAALRAVGPVGSCLTGGLDSAAVTLAAHRAAPPGRLFALTRVPQAGPLPRDDASRYHDESPRAAALAALHPGLAWHPVADDGGDWGEHDAQRWFLEAGLPPVSVTQWAWFFPLYRFVAARGGRVLLNGDHGNFFFSSAGGTAELALLRQGRVVDAWRMLRARGRQGGTGTLVAARRWLLAPFLPLSWHNRRRGFPAEPWGFFAALAPAFADETRLRERLDLGRYKLRAGVRLPSTRRSREWMLQDEAVCEWYVTARALHGLDQRAPLASRRLIEFFAALPLEDFIADGVPRALARAVLDGRVPRATLVPGAVGMQQGDWFSVLSARRPAMLAAMPRLRASALARRIVDLDRIQRLLDDWPADVDAAEARRLDYAFVLTRGYETAEFLAWRERGNG